MLDEELPHHPAGADLIGRATTRSGVRARVDGAKHPLLVRPFALGALAVALAGSTLGAILLLRIQLALGPVAPLWIARFARMLRDAKTHGCASVFSFLTSGITRRNEEATQAPTSALPS
jgi:hypothetical protein